MKFEFMVLFSLIVLGAFALQSYLAFKQIKHFSKEYEKMRREGKVAIGKCPGKIQSGTIILFALDDFGRIRYGKKMQGTTVLAKFRDFNKFNGRKISEITLEDSEMKNELKITRKAVMNAVENYNAFMSGKSISEKKTPFGKVYDKLVH
jgi:glucitol operon activator protein